MGSNNLTFSGNTLALGSKTFAILGQKGGNVDTMADALGQLTTLSNATLATTADLTVGRGALLVAGTSSVTLGGQLKTSSDWADFKMQDSASVTATGGIDFHANNVVTSQMELNGGTLTTPSIIGNSYNGTKVNFNGTHVVVSPGAGNADFLEVYLNSSRTTTTSASIDAGGAIIDTAGNNANINIGFANSGATVKGNLKKLGAGTLTLAGASSYSGGTTINAGTLALAGSGTLGVAGNALSLNSGATLDLGGTTQTVGQVNAAAAGNGAVGTITNGSIVMNGAAFYLQNGTFTANLSGSGASRLWIGGDSAATVFLGGINTSTYTDSHSTIIGHATTGAAGTVELLSPTALGPASQQTQVFAGTLDLNGQSGVSVGSIVLESGVSSAFVNNNTSAAASFNNTLDLNANTPSVGGNGTLSLGGVVQNGTLKKVGSGTLILAGNNSYSGGTTVTAGTLLAGNSAGSATGSGLVTVASNAVVGGSGTIRGALKLDGGSIRPSAGNNANGVQLTLSGGLSITANGGAYVPQLISTANYDSLSVASSVNIAGATLALDDSSYVPSALVNDKFYIIQGTTPISGTFTNAPATYTDAFGITYQVEYNVAGPNATTNDVALTVQSVPEPTSLALAAAGLCGLLARRRRKA